MQAQCLVTGCCGFVGSNLVDALLSRGYSVIGIDSLTSYYSPGIKKSNIASALGNKSFKLIEEDILNIATLPKVDYVFHEAAQPGVRRSWGAEFEFYVRNNVMATQKVLEQYKNSSLKKLVLASSSSVYGTALTFPTTEDSNLAPVSPYGVTKLASEKLVWSYATNYDISAVCLRYFTVYGPRQRPDMAIFKFMKSVSEGKVLRVSGDGHQTRDFTFVGDVVGATIAAAENSVQNETINIGSGTSVTLLELVESIEAIVGIKANINFVPSEKGDAEATYADIGKARRMLGYQPTTSLEQGLLSYSDWFSENSFRYEEDCDLNIA
jgi:UDP-glucose 4-epimerase